MKSIENKIHKAILNKNLILITSVKEVGIIFY
jgi:hypothetical protein